MSKISREQFQSNTIADNELLHALDELHLYDAKEIDAIISLIRERRLALEKKYYYRKGSIEFGPFDEIEFFEIGQNGVISPDTYICKKEDMVWKKAKEIYEFTDEPEEKENISVEAPHTQRTRKKKVLRTMLVVLAVCITLTLIISLVKFIPTVIEKDKVNALNTLVEDSQWEDAYNYYIENYYSITYGGRLYSEWSELGYVSGSNLAQIQYDNKQYEQAYNTLIKLGSYNYNVYSSDLYKKVTYAYANQMLANQQYQDAMNLFYQISGYEDADACYQLARMNYMAIAKAEYNTGIDYYDLARTPDYYVGQKVIFIGKVIQVLEGDTETNLRIAINADYNCVVLAYYSSDLVSSRVLEGDMITIYGISRGLYTYESTLGQDITVPLISVQFIE